MGQTRCYIPFLPELKRSDFRQVSGQAAARNRFASILAATRIALSALILSATASPAWSQVNVTLIPVSPPIQIPAEGGSFDYNIAANNTTGGAVNFDVWCMVTLPNGNPYGPVLGPANLNLAAGGSIERLRTQIVPAGAPSGTYAYIANVGAYPDTIWDSDSFQFEKLATQPGGTELWVARYDGPGNNYFFDDGATSLAVDAYGNVYVTGWSYGIGTVADYATVKYDASGNQLWVARYNGPGNSYDWARSLAVDSVGNVYVTGQSYGNGTYYDYATIKYDPSGNQLWAVRYNGPGNGYDAARSLTVYGNGNVYISGSSYGSGTGYDYATIKYDASGNQLWVARYNDSANGADSANFLRVDYGGNVYVTGRSGGNYGTIKYSASGNQLWVALYSVPGFGGDEARSLALDDNRNVYVTGQSFASFQNSDYATIKYNAAGQQQWVARYDGGSVLYADCATSIAVDSVGNVYVTGISFGNGTSYDYATIKYNAFGNQLWVSRYNGPGNSTDEAFSLAVDSTGNVYVTGDAGQNYGTVKYDASGNQVWAALYNGPGNNYDAAFFLAMDGNGNVCVTGESMGSGNGTDYATIKYSGGSVDNWMPVEATVLGAQPCAPTEYRLEQNFPNPFNATTVLSFQLPVAGFVNLSIYDISGRNVGAQRAAPLPLVNGWRQAGAHEVTFDASDLPSGVYLARITAGDFTQTTKMVLLK